MTETILVAIIGVSGIVVGSLLTVFVTYMTTKAQNSSRTNELRLQCEHERTEKQITRLIERRASYLNPIGEHLQSITKSVHHLETKLRDLVMTCGDDDIIAWADSRSGKYVRGMTLCIKSISESTDGIEMLRTQNTDSRLQSLINKTLSLCSQVSKDISTLNTIRYEHGQGNIGDNPNRQISQQCVHTCDLTIELFKSIRETNQRIEEILSGME